MFILHIIPRKVKAFGKLNIVSFKTVRMVCLYSKVQNARKLTG